ncbi:histidine kinase [Steroidobacter agaridevorans]|uniref:Histidine kinase n=2 Tax=Steroidobacter agaridevorans TaxID=2695856 RepID=A0A829YE21_9GAMM|nr:histidine kinase [Steroidobacter agaridevorans]
MYVNRHAQGRIHSHLMRILTFVLLACASRCAFALDPAYLLSQYGHTSWRLQDGSLPAVPDPIAQSADGYLWIGTTGGLYRFDGVRFTRWVSEFGEELAAKNVTALLGTPDGSLWIGSDSGLDRLRDGRLTRISKELDATIVELTLEPDGSIWAVRTYGAPFATSLCRVHEDRLQCPAPLPGLELTMSSCCARGFLREADGSIWLGADLGMIHWQAGKTSAIYPAALSESRGMAGVVGVARTRRGDLWVAMARDGREGGLQRLVNGKFQPLVTTGFDSSALSIFALYKDRQDTLWVATADQGLLRIDGDRVERFRASDGLSADNVLRLFEDREGNVWVSTVRGLDRFREFSVVPYSTREGLSSDDTGSVMARADGSVWLGTSQGVNILRDGRVSKLDRGPAVLRDHQITSMFEDASGRLWLGAAQSMFIFDRGTFTPVEDAEGRPSGLVASIAQDTRRNVWMQLAARERKLMRVEGTRIVEQLREPQVPPGREVAADPAGGIWIGTMSGDLARYRDGQLETISFADVNPDITERHVDDLIVLADGTVMGAAGYGLIETQRGQRRALVRSNGLPCDRVWAMQFDRSEDLWLSLECGFVRITKGELAAWRQEPSRRVALRWFDALDGATPTRAPFMSESAMSKDGRLWFPSLNGTHVIDPSRLKEPAAAPPVHIEAIVADRKQYSVRSRPVFPALTRDIEIDYTAPSLALPQKLTFRYRLGGYEEHWQEVGTRRQAFYNDLAPGRYTFHVTACNHDAVCNEQGASFGFEVLPTFYQTAWFIVLAILASVLLLWAVLAIRVRQVATRIRSRLEASLEERERIARELHDTFLQSVQGLMLKFQGAMEKIPTGEPARDLMEQALDRADVVLVEGRKRVTALRHSTRAQRDFTAAIRQLVAHVSEDTVVDVRLTVEGQSRGLHPVVAEEAERILSEGLTNALRHANAHTIQIEILYSRRELTVRLVDDGRGFDESVLQAAPADGHWGLAGMRERARKIQAQFEIASRPDAGTSIELRVPANIAYASDR